MAVFTIFVVPLARAQETVARDTLPRREGAGFVLQGDWLRRLPVDDPRAALFLVPGVVSREFGPGIIVHGDASVRENAPGRASVYIDGAPARVALTGQDGMQPSIAAIEALTVTTGVPEVWLGDAGGGVLAFETRGGGARLAGDLRVESDELFGDGTAVGYNRFEAWVGGPVPLLRGMTWAGSGAIVGQRSRYRGPGAADYPLFVIGGLDSIIPETDPQGSVSQVALPQYVQASGSCGGLGGGGALGTEIRGNYGYDCTGLRLPMDWSTDIRLHGKLAYRYGAGGRVTLTGLAAGHQERDFPGQAIGAPGLSRGYHAWSRLVVANWTQPLRLVGRRATLAANLSWGSDRVVEGPLTPESDGATRAPALGIELEPLTFTGGEALPFPITDQIIRNVRTNSGLRVPYLGRSDLMGAQPYRLNPYGLLGNGWYTGGIDAPLTLLSEQRWQGRSSLTWRVDDRHELLLGAEAGRIEASWYDAGSLVERIDLDAFRVDPARLGLFASDRMRLGILTADVGLRYDRFGGGGLLPVTPGRTFTHPRWLVEAATNDSVYAALLADTAIWRPVATHSTVSPRARATLGVAPTTAARLAFGRQVDPPSLQQVYGRSNNDLAYTFLSDVFGRDVDYAAQWLVEAGVSHRFAPGLGLDLALYRRTGDRYVARFQPFVDPVDPTDTLFINALTTVDAPSVAGVELLLDWSGARPVSGQLAYALSRGGGLTVQQVAGVARWRGPDSGAAGPLGAVTRGLAATVVFRLTSGLAYTRLSNTGSGRTFLGPRFGIGGRADGVLDGERLPWSWQLDLRVEKGWRLRGLDAVAFMDLRNPFDIRSQVDLFLETGGVENVRHRTETIGDPMVGSREYAQLWNEAAAVGAFDPATRAVTFGNCRSWDEPVNCESLRRVEARFGDGNGTLDFTEQQRAFNAYYDAFFGPARFYQAGRTARMGLRLTF